jgi:hypothetical protein
MKQNKNLKSECWSQNQRTRPMPEGPSLSGLLTSFCLGYFSLSKQFNYIAKDTSILHLKSSTNDRPRQFLTFTPSKHSPHCHDRPITESDVEMESF